MILPIQVLNRLGPGDKVVNDDLSHTVSVAKDTGRLPLNPEKTASPVAK